MLGEGWGEGEGTQSLPAAEGDFWGVDGEREKAVAHCPSTTRPPPAAAPLHTEQEGVPPVGVGTGWAKVPRRGILAPTPCHPEGQSNPVSPQLQTLLKH
jgi:hypothetical protein